ncbi:MAG: hypothetical protein DCC75_00305 [Proteobacteria bacterium]|nr:MAG: hypothetical protein DCC75_00305 [Pseudomonadota bacterium]
MGLVIFLLLLAATILLRSFIFDSLWLDETLSYWVASASYSEVCSRALEFQGQSPFYYLILSVWMKIFPHTEFYLRLPSLFFLAVSCFVLYKLAQYFSPKGPAVLAVVLFISQGQVLSSISARPYSLSLCCALIATYLIVSWLERPASIRLCGYCAALVATFYAHYLFILVVLWHLFHIAVNYRGLMREKWLALFTCYLAAALAYIPALPHLFSLGARGEELSFAVAPSLTRFLSVTFPPNLLLYLIFSLLLCILFTQEKPRDLLSNRTSLGMLYSLLCLLLLGPLALLFSSYLLGGSLFVERYFLWQSPALPLLGTMLGGAIVTKRAKRMFLASICFFALLFELDRRWEIEDWRGAITQIESVRQKDSGEIFVYTGLIEAGDTDWLRDASKSAYLQGPINYYPLSQKPLLLPPNLESQPRRDYFNEVVLPALGSDYAVYGILSDKKFRADGSQDISVSEYYGGEFRRLGYESSIILDSKALKVFKFEKISSSSQK